MEERKMTQTEITLPKMGESIAEATITKWLKQEGEEVEEDESIVEIATDKVDSELPSPVSGRLIKILVPEGEVALIGQAIALIEHMQAEGEGGPSPVMLEVEAQHTPAELHATGSATATRREAQPAARAVQAEGKAVFFSPLVRNIAKEEQISEEDLKHIPGSGKGGRVTKKDLLAYLKSRQSGALSSDADSEPLNESAYSGTEVIEMGRMRKLIASHMIASKQTSAHVTSFVEADVSGLVSWRNKIKAAYEKQTGQKITFTPVFIQACVKAIKDYPMINVSVEGDRIMKKKYIHLGLATALPDGNLIVPVIKNADMLNLNGLVNSVNDLTNRARTGRLKPEETQDGTFTLTNIGTFGSILGTPIINQPQVAILATGVIRKRVVVIESPNGDSIGIRHMMYLSLSYDHRVVDGALGGMFLMRVKHHLESFDAGSEI